MGLIGLSVWVKNIGQNYRIKFCGGGEYSDEEKPYSMFWIHNEE